MGLTAGQELLNRYKIEKSIGKGGMGAVYRAWDTRLEVAVAIKEMIPQPGIDADTLEQFRRQFRREARTRGSGPSLSSDTTPRESRRESRDSGVDGQPVYG